MCDDERTVSIVPGSNLPSHNLLDGATLLVVYKVDLGNDARD
jgi:hypothetical protein